MPFKLVPGLKVKYASDEWGISKDVIITLTQKCNCCDAYLSDYTYYNDPANCEYVSQGMVDTGVIVLAFEADPGVNCAF